MVRETERKREGEGRGGREGEREEGRGKEGKFHSKAPGFSK